MNSVSVTAQIRHAPEGFGKFDVESEWVAAKSCVADFDGFESPC